MPTDDLIPGHGSAWLQLPADRVGDDPSPATPSPATGRARIVLVSAAVAGATIAATTLAVGLTGQRASTEAQIAATQPSTITSVVAATSTVRVAEPACEGLSAPTVTSGPGDIGTPAGVIAAFEHAYYRLRDPVAALALVSPSAGLVPEAITAAIAALPEATTHCVAITVIASNTAEVHLVELHGDGTRFDYLQLINVGVGDQGLLITNIQKRGS